MSWHKFNKGKTLGKIGSEEGKIISDIEYNCDARITIEEDGITAPFSVTMGIYSVMMHTEFFATMEQAENYQNKIMPIILQIIQLFDTDETDRDEEWKNMLNEYINLIINGF